jgi:predicted DNA-binding protein (MmcQ/YjbR family)
MGGDEGFLRGDLRRKILSMDLPDAIEFSLSLPAAEETVPFGPDVLVYKVGGKIFALTQPDEFPSKMNLKCDPARAISLREDHDAIVPGYHMNKQHWNTVQLDGISSDLLRELIRHSYDLVVASLPKAKRPS